MFFGGLPINSVKNIPIIKIVEKYPNLPKTKRFTLNAFLDKYLNELKPPKTNYD
jgi:hypothetical protein